MKQILKHLLDQRVEPSLYNIIKNQKIIMLGDDHNMNKGRRWLEMEIKTGKLNINFLCLEYIEVSQQKLINHLDKQKLLAYLKKSYMDFPGFNPNSVLNLITSAKKAGISTKAIEIPENSFGEWNNEISQNARTKFIAKQITKASKLGNGLVLLGADHVEKKEDTVYGLVKKSLGDVVSVIFIGGKNWTIDTNEYWIRRLELQIKTEKLDKKLFALNTTEYDFPCDWIIHFPQE